MRNDPRPGSRGDVGSRVFGGDPYWVGEMGRAYIRGVHLGGQGRVLTVYLRVGKMSSAVPDHLRFFFGLLTEGTPLEGATLDIEMVPVRCRCGDCGIEFENDNANLACAGCASGRLEVITGRELLIESVEVE